MCNAGDPGLIPGLVRSPGEGKGYPLQCSVPENSMDRSAWQLQLMGSQRVRHDWATFTMAMAHSRPALLPHTILLGLRIRHLLWASQVAVLKNWLANAGDMGPIPGSGRSPGEGTGNPLQDSCMGDPTDRGTQWASVQGVSKSWAHTCMGRPEDNSTF